MLFESRESAGLQLAERMKNLSLINPIVLAIPRGGVPIGYVVSRELNLPLEIFLSKKIGHPYNPEFAIGSVTQTDWILSKDAGSVSRDYIDEEVREIQDQLSEKYKLFMGDKEPVDLAGRDIILVDDGVATGYTLLSAAQAIRKQKPNRIIAAVPVASHEAYSSMVKTFDEVVCLLIPSFFIGVGQFYQDFTQVEDEEVKKMLSSDENKLVF